MPSRPTVFFAMVLLSFSLPFAVGAPTTSPVSESSGQLTERQRNLLLQLSNAEANIQAINKALPITGYKVGVAYDRIDSNRKGNELMDRKGGGPVRWDDFYGRTARDFYAPQSWGTYHREGNGKTVDIKVAENYTQLKRPEQFDYIYKANDDQIARANEQIVSLQNNQAALLARRQFHESDQSRLWATLAWERVQDREISFRPLYRFRLKPNGTDAGVLRPIICFLRAADIASTNGLDSLKADQTATFTKTNQQMRDAYRLLQQSLTDALSASELKPDHAKQGETLKALCKQLAEESEVIADNYQKAVDSDRAKEDTSKLAFRAELQGSLAYFAAAITELDQRIIETAAAWVVTGEPGVANPDEGSLAALARALQSSVTTAPAVTDAPPGAVELGRIDDWKPTKGIWVRRWTEQGSELEPHARSQLYLVVENGGRVTAYGWNLLLLRERDGSLGIEASHFFQAFTKTASGKITVREWKRRADYMDGKEAIYAGIFEPLEAAIEPPNAGWKLDDGKWSRRWCITTVNTDKKSWWTDYDITGNGTPMRMPSKSTIAIVSENDGSKSVAEPHLHYFELFTRSKYGIVVREWGSRDDYVANREPVRVGWLER